LFQPNAPPVVKRDLDSYEKKTGERYWFSKRDRTAWLEELACDLFGLLLFGPSFLAAHRAILRPKEPDPYDINLMDSTHPPYAVRQKMLIIAMKALGWDSPQIKRGKKAFRNAEKAFLKYVMESPYDAWADIFTKDQLITAIAGIKRLFKSKGTLGYDGIDANLLVMLLESLKNKVPPLSTVIKSDGTPELSRLPISIL
jgi:hypothetical protein